jgi:uncharacterized delta-60 repeat protein
MAHMNVGVDAMSAAHVASSRRRRAIVASAARAWSLGRGRPAALPPAQVFAEPLERRVLLAAQLVPAADADVETRPADANYAKANFGADPQLRVSGDPADQIETFVTFDLGTVTSVGSAAITLTGGLEDLSAAQEQIAVFAVPVTTWVEGNGLQPTAGNPLLNMDDNPLDEIRWNNRPGSAGGPLDTQVVDLQTAYTWNVTAYVQAQVAAGATAVSFGFRSVNAGGKAAFASGEAGGAGPVLAVEYDVDSPVATAVAADVSAGGATTHAVVVTYTDDAGIKPSTIDVGDLSVTGPGGPLTVTGVTSVDAADPKAVVVTYAVQPPGGAWDVADNGSYSIAIAGGQVLDLNNNAAVGGGAFDVAVPADLTLPVVAAVNAPAITAGGGTTYSFSITYADAGGIDAGSINAADVTVARSGGGPALVVASGVAAGTGASVTATYVVEAPGGTWDGTDNGTYTIAVNGGQVLDLAGNAVASGGGTFAVAVPIDTTPPTVVSVNAQNVTAAGGTTYTFTVTYADDEQLNPATIEATDVVVARAGGAPLAVTNVTKSGTGQSVAATYTLAVPGGTWDAGDNGTYAITIATGSVADAAGNPVAAGSGTFAVNVPDTNSPGVTISPIPAITTAGVTTTFVTVVYTDNQGIDATTVDAGDLSAVRDGGAALAVTLASATPSGGGTAVEAVYALSAPGGFWNNADNGGYTVTVAPGAVKDSSGNATPLASAAFAVDILSDTPVVDGAFNGGNPISTGFVAEAICTDAAGRILVAGRQGDRAAGQSQSVLQRLNADGSLDTFFGEGGQVIADAGAADGFFAVTTDAKGRIVVAGFAGGDVEVLRFDAKGKADKKFGQGGRAVADWGGTDDAAYAVATTPGGQVVVGGTGGGRLVVARFTDRGAVDGSFADAGLRALQPVAGAPAAVGSIALLADGSVLAAGTAGATVVLVKLDAAGGTVAGFGAGGAVIGGVLTVDGLGVRSDLPGQDHTVGLAVAPGGEILVGNRSTAGDFGVRRYAADGSADATFGGGDGLATIDLGGSDDVDYVGLQGTGQILLVGTSDAGAGVRVAVAALNADGTPDGSFASGGKFTADAGVVAAAAAGAAPPAAAPLHVNATTEADGRLLVTAASAAGLPSSSPLRRLVAPGSGVVGSFGAVAGKSTKLTFLDGDGSRVTVSLKGGGTGRVLSDGNVFDVVLTGTGPTTSLAVAAKGGDKRMTVRDLRADGPIKAIVAKTTDVVGTWAVGGDAKSISIGSLSGTLAVAGSVRAVAVARNLAGAFLLAGVSLGADARIGGTGADSDAYATARIDKLTIGGAAAGAYVGAGVDPGTGGTFGNADDRAPGGAAAALPVVVVKGGVDATTVFATGRFGTAKLPTKVVPADDPHFRLLPA